MTLDASAHDQTREPITLASAKAARHETALPNDNRNKRNVVIVTIGVLIYPLLFAVAYPAAASLLNLDEDVSFPIGGFVIQGLENIVFAGLGVAILLVNLFFAYRTQRHLQKVHEHVREAVGKIRGFAAAGGPDANKVIDDALASFTYLLSWRYLFSYVGPVTLAFYLAFSLVWAVAPTDYARSLLPDTVEPATILAVWVLGYYVLALGVREGLRAMLREYLDD